MSKFNKKHEGAQDVISMRVETPISYSTDKKTQENILKERQLAKELRLLEKNKDKNTKTKYEQLQKARLKQRAYDEKIHHIACKSVFNGKTLYLGFLLEDNQYVLRFFNRKYRLQKEEFFNTKETAMEAFLNHSKTL